METKVSLFENVESWLATNPSKEEVAMVLRVVNRKAVSNARGLLWQKSNELHKLTKLTENMESLKVPVAKEVKEMMKSIEKEITTIKKMLPAVVKRTKVVEAPIESNTEFDTTQPIETIEPIEEVK